MNAATIRRPGESRYRDGRPRPTRRADTDTAGDGGPGAAARTPVRSRRAPLAPITRWTIGAVGLALLIALAAVASRLATDPARFPVASVDVLGTLDYTDRDALRASVEEEVRRGFYGLDIDTVRRRVETLPWVARARVSRVWPAGLSIDIDEHEPAARWNGDALISKRLALFHPPQLALDHARASDWRELFGALPRLVGEAGRHAAVLGHFRHYARELGRFGVGLEALEEDARRSQTMRLDNGVTVRLGHEDRARRLARFVDVHERLVRPLGGRAATFDMRYSNGFALQGAGADGVTAGGVKTTDGVKTGEGDPGWR